MVLSLAQFPIPGAVELVIVVFVLILLAIPVVAVVVVFALFGRDDDTDERIAQLEREVEALREERETPSDRPDDQVE